MKFPLPVAAQPKLFSSTDNHQFRKPGPSVFQRIAHRRIGVIIPLFVSSTFAVAVEASAVALEIPLDEVSATYSGGEREILRMSLLQALNHGRDGRAAHWSSDKTRARGRIKILSTTGKSPDQCRSVRITNYLATGSAKSTKVYRFCQGANGQWVVPGGSPSLPVSSGGPIRDRQQP